MAVVTEAFSGIGEATARALAADRWRVILVGRRRGELERAAAALGPGRAVVAALDAANGTAVLAMAERVIREHGVPDLIVHCAGAGRWRFVDETTPSAAVEMMNAPYFSAFNVTHAFMAGMLARRQGQLVPIDSAASIVPWPGATGYLAPRWARRGLHEALLQDLRGTGVRSLRIVFGEVAGPYFDHNRAATNGSRASGGLSRGSAPNAVPGSSGERWDHDAGWSSTRSCCAGTGGCMWWLPAQCAGRWPSRAADAARAARHRRPVGGRQARIGCRPVGELAGLLVGLHHLAAATGPPGIDRARGWAGGSGRADRAGPGADGRGQSLRQPVLRCLPTNPPQEQQAAPRLNRQEGCDNRLGREMHLGEVDGHQAGDHRQGAEGRRSGRPPDGSRPPDDASQVADLLSGLGDRRRKTVNYRAIPTTRRAAAEAKAQRGSGPILLPQNGQVPGAGSASSKPTAHLLW